ncbi:MAG: UDP-2,3-diacylglucosamine diphosphatase LpxI [Alphaproteobacteria bacterium]|nr:UDP-2,3-diacylglucosamine diphosphatase LpxI [Alphaproteobacteria bacterium]
MGLIAGGGELPRAVALAARAAGREVFVVPLVGSLDPTGAEDWVRDFPHEFLSPGEPGRIVKAMRTAGVSEVLLAGKVDRPKFSEIKLDAKGMLLLPRAIAAAKKGDDALLRFIVGICEDEGLKAVSVAQAAPSLVAQEGLLGRVSPDGEHQADILQAFKIAHALGALDVGQAAVVCEGLALAVEAAEGTDAMLSRIANLRESLRGTAGKKRGVLVKALKPTQDTRADLPVVGVQTVKNVAAAYLAGIALEAGAALILDKAAVAAEADRLGLFVIGLKP